MVSINFNNNNNKKNAIVRCIACMIHQEYTIYVLERKQNINFSLAIIADFIEDLWNVHYKSFMSCGKSSIISSSWNISLTSCCQNFNGDDYIYGFYSFSTSLGQSFGDLHTIPVMYFRNNVFYQTLAHGHCCYENIIIQKRIPIINCWW